MDEKQRYSQKEVLELGFTKSLIETLLPPPTLEANPYFPGGHPLKFWDKAVGESAMETSEFRSIVRPNIGYDGRGITMKEWNRIKGWK